MLLYNVYEAYNHFAVGWAWAMDTPYQWTKQVASHWGGTRNGTIVHLLLQPLWLAAVQDFWKYANSVRRASGADGVCVRWRGLAKGGNVILYLDGNKVGEWRVNATVPMLFSADETTDLGSDSGTPVTDDFGPKDSAFNGTVKWVQIDL